MKKDYLYLTEMLFSLKGIRWEQDYKQTLLLYKRRLWHPLLSDPAEDTHSVLPLLPQGWWWRLTIQRAIAFSSKHTPVKLISSETVIVREFKRVMTRETQRTNIFRYVEFWTPSLFLPCWSSIFLSWKLQQARLEKEKGAFFQMALPWEMKF